MSEGPLSSWETVSAVLDARAKRGPRDIGRNTHLHFCDGFDCPCYKDGWAFTVSSHLDVLDEFCKKAPDLVRERLALMEISE